MKFPFERNKFFTIGELRAFENELTSIRQSNPALSKNWRVPKGKIVAWDKIRQETYPLKLFADHSRLSNEAKFRLSPAGHPSPVDVELLVSDERRLLQITTAHPVRDGSVSGGYDHRLRMEGLNKGPVQGFGPFVRRDGKIIGSQSGTTPVDDLAACVRGLSVVLRRKQGQDGRGCELVIFACNFHFNSIDVGFEMIVHTTINACGRPRFDRTFVFDESPLTFVEI